MIKLLKPIFLFFLLTLIALSSCSKTAFLTSANSNTKIKLEKFEFKTVSINEALNLFKTPTKHQLAKTNSVINLQPQLTDINQTAIKNTSQFITGIPAKTNFPDINTNIILVKYQDSIIKTLINLVPNKSSQSKNFSGIVGFTDLQGNFINAYRMIDGIFVSRFIKSNNPKKYVSLADDTFQVPIYNTKSKNYANKLGGTLDEVDLGTVTNNNSFTYLNFDVATNSSDSYTDIGNITYTGGGTSNANSSTNSDVTIYPCNDPIHGCADNCGDGYIKDENGVCVPNKIIDSLSNPCAKGIFEELQNNLYTQDSLKPEIIIPNEAINLNFSESILKLFNDSNSTNLLIRNGDIGNANAHTIGATITLDNSYIESATQLSIARTMIHESVHAYINALYSNVVEFNSYTFSQKLEKYASDNGYTIGTNSFQHNFMGQFVEAMAYSLYEWDRDYGTGGNLGWNYYYATGFGGLFQTDTNGTIVAETNSFKSIIPDPVERQKIADIIFNELKNNQDAKGTKCN